MAPHKLPDARYPNKNHWFTTTSGARGPRHGIPFSDDTRNEPDTAQTHEGSLA